MVPIMPDLIDQSIIKSRIFQEQIEILHKNLLLSIPANLVCAAVVYVGLVLTNNRYIGMWFAAVVLVSIIRLLGFYYYKKSSNKSPSYHLYVFLIGLVLSAILWGIVASVLMPTSSITEQMIVIVIVAGVTAGGAQTLNAHLPSALIYIFVIIAPLCVWFYLQEGIAYILLTVTMDYRYS